MNKALIYLILIATLLCAGCGSRAWSDTKDFANDSYDYMFDTAPTARSYHDVEEVPIIELNHRAAEELADHVSWSELDRESPVYFTQFINKGDPADTAIFSHVVTDQVVDGLVQNKIKMTLGEPKPIETMPEEKSELMATTPPLEALPMLADNATVEATDEMKEEEKAKETMVRNEEPEPIPDARLTGSYVIGDNFIYMRAMIVRLTDEAVISAHNWTLPITDNVRELLPQLKVDHGLAPSVRTSFD